MLAGKNEFGPISRPRECTPTESSRPRSKPVFGVRLKVIRARTGCAGADVVEFDYAGELEESEQGITIRIG